MRLLAAVVALTAIVLAAKAEIDVPIDKHWDGGFKGTACFDITQEMHGWKVTLTFDKVVSSLEAWTADVTQKYSNGHKFDLENKAWNGDEHVGDQLCIDFQGHGNGDINPKVTASITPLTGGGGTHAPAITAAPGHTLPPKITTTPRPLAIPDGNGIPGTLTVGGSWGHTLDGLFRWKATESYIGYLANITFDQPVTKMEVYTGTPIWHSADGHKWIVVNKASRVPFESGDNIDVKFRAVYTGSTAPNGKAVLINLSKDDWRVSPISHKFNSKCNYADAIYKSILFYEAQRSGKLPSDNRIPWRGDSALGDKGDKGEDLTGGWYDAGDHVKFNFPMAYSVTALAWGYLVFKDGYVSAGQVDELLDSIKWPLDYLIKCHTAPNELYVQVGDGSADHSFWGKPEDMTMARPAYKIDASNPGSDVAFETAAAMAAGYLVFKDQDRAYANRLLQHAKQLWEFANSHKGKYSDSVHAAAGFYRSNNATDETCWGSLWLYKATNDPKYLKVAEDNFDPEPAWGQSWDEKTIGNQILLYEATSTKKYKDAVIQSLDGWLPGGTVPYTPKGLAFRLQWGSLRYSSNMAMAALVAAELGIKPTDYRHWAMCQIHYALCDGGFSYQIGYGDSYPMQPHHRSSSCPVSPAPCGSTVMRSAAPNVHILYGALVGGPGKSDNYADDRSNYVNNEVACDYNAGFQGALAALEHLLVVGEHPEKTGHGSCPYK